MVGAMVGHMSMLGTYVNGGDIYQWWGHISMVGAMMGHISMMGAYEVHASIYVRIEKYRKVTHFYS